MERQEEKNGTRCVKKILALKENFQSLSFREVGMLSKDTLSHWCMRHNWFHSSAPGSITKAAPLRRSELDGQTNTPWLLPEGCLHIFDESHTLRHSFSSPHISLPSFSHGSPFILISFLQIEVATSIQSWGSHFLLEWSIYMARSNSFFQKLYVSHNVTFNILGLSPSSEMGIDKDNMTKGAILSCPTCTKIALWIYMVSRRTEQV